MRGSPRDARNYELMTVLSPDVPEEEIQGTVERVIEYVTSAGGSIVNVSRESPWGRRRLAYPIRHGGRDVRDGFYTLYHFQAEPHRVEDIERELKLNDQVMRYLLTQYTPQPIAEMEPAETAEPEGEEEARTEVVPEPSVESEADAEATVSPAVASTDGGGDAADAEEATPPEEA